MEEEETKLKVNLEDVVILSESIGKIAQEVYASHIKIVNNKDSIKTPTEEQIEQIRYILQYTRKLSKNDIREVITEWEKIRS